MAEFTINDEDFASLQGKVVVLTGCSSGIGLATTNLLLTTGALVVGGDLNPTPVDHPNFVYVKTSVTAWDELSALFRAAKDKHGRIDHVFANAGLVGRMTYLEETFDDGGNLLEPNHTVIDVNLRAVINTGVLAIHYMRRQDSGGSIVATASASSFQPLRMVDYSTSKHGVLGFVRGMVPNFKSNNIPIRINAIAPSWTVTGMLPPGVVEAFGGATQPPEAPARSVALLMADSSRQGQLIYSWEGRFKEAEVILTKAAEDILEVPVPDDVVVERIQAARAASKK